jgi:hypothetical protein
MEIEEITRVLVRGELERKRFLEYKAIFLEKNCTKIQTELQKIT